MAKKIKVANQIENSRKTHHHRGNQTLKHLNRTNQ